MADEDLCECGHLRDEHVEQRHECQADDCKCPCFDLAEEEPER